MEQILKDAISKIVSESKFIILSFDDYNELMLKSKLIVKDGFNGSIKFDNIPIYYDLAIKTGDFLIKS